eukprot:13594702-Heterocapsa_arctica.AAC.1
MKLSDESLNREKHGVLWEASGTHALFLSVLDTGCTKHFHLPVSSVDSTRSVFRKLNFYALNEYK